MDFGPSLLKVDLYEQDSKIKSLHDHHIVIN